MTLVDHSLDGPLGKGVRSAIHMSMVLVFTRLEVLNEELSERVPDGDMEFEEFDDIQSVKRAVAFVFPDLDWESEARFVLTARNIALSYIVAAQWDLGVGSEELAVLDIAEAHYWIGIACGCRGESISRREITGEVARNAARERHKETYKLKMEAISEWKSRIDPSLSNEKAARILSRYIPLTTRTLSGYVAEAKRELEKENKKIKP